MSLNAAYPRFKAWKANGSSPASGYLLYTYESGTTIPKTTYSNVGLTVANANPIILDANGEAVIFLSSGSYRFDLKSPQGALVWTFDPIQGQGVSLDSVDTIAEIRTLAPGSRAVVQVLGYYTPGDGGGGTFYFDPSSTDSEDFGLTLLPSSAPVTGRWKRLFTGPVSVKFFGALGNGTTDDYTALARAANHATGNPADLYFPGGTYKVSTSLTFPAGSRPIFEADAILSPDATVVITLGSAPEAGLSQHFAGLGNIVFDVPSVITVYPQWWGATGDGTTDDIAAIKAAIEALRRSDGGVLFFPPGEYAISNRIQLTSNLTIRGAGRALTLFKPTGSVAGFTALNVFIGARDYTFSPTDVPDITADYYGPHYDIVLEDFTVDGPTDVSRPRGGGAIRIQYVYGLRISRVHVRRASDEGIRIDGYGAGPFVFDVTNPVWGNAANVVVEDCYIEDAYVGVEFEGGINGGSVRNCTVDNVIRGFRSTSSYKTVWTGNRVLSLKYTTHYGAAVVDPVGMMSQQSRDITFSENYIDTGDDVQIAFSNSTTERGKFLNNIVARGYYSEATGTGFTTAFPDDCEVVGNRFTGLGVTVDGYDNVLFRLRKSKRIRFDQNTFVNGKAVINDVCTGSGCGNRGTIINLRTADFFAMNTTVGDNSNYNTGPVKVIEDVAGDLVALTVDNTNAAGGTAQVISNLWRFLGSGFARDGARLKVSKTSDYSALSSRDASMTFGVAENGVLADILHLQQDRATIRAGLAATPNANLGGVLKSAVTNTQNITSGETDLHTYTIPANTLSAARHSVQLLAEGSYGATANAKTIRVYYGATVIFTTGALAINTSTWRVMVNITRVDSTTAIYSVKMDCPDALLTQALGFISGELTGLDWTVTNVFKLTGQGLASGDIRQKASKYLWLPDGN